MIPDDVVGQKLHDRATRGQSLSPEEHVALAEWYRHHDEAEARQFALAKPPEDLEELRKEHRRILRELADTAERIAAKKAENEKLFLEVAELRNKLKERRSKLPA